MDIWGWKKDLALINKIGNIVRLNAEMDRILAENSENGADIVGYLHNKPVRRDELTSDVLRDFNFYRVRE